MGMCASRLKSATKWLLFSTVPLFAQSLPPEINGVVNSYSFIQQGLPNYGIARGSIFTIFGSNMAGTTASQGIPLGSKFQGLTIDVTIGDVTTHALPYYVSPGQINALLPSQTPAGEGTLVLTSNGQAMSASIHVVPSAFGLLAQSGSRSNAVIDNFNQGGELLSQTNAANPGEYITLWGSGIGPTSGDESQYQTPNNLVQIPIEVDIGGVPATVTYHGRSTYPGLDQINVIVPSGVSGCLVSVVVVVAGVPSNFATLPVAPSGRTCSDPALTMLTVNDYENLATLDSVNVGLLSVSTGVSNQPSSVTGTPSAFGLFQRYTAAQTNSAGFLMQPSLGSCLVLNGAGPPPYFQWSSPAQLNAGALINVTGPAGSLRLMPGYPGYAEPAGTSASIIGSTGGLLTVTNSSGGSDLGAFTATLNVDLTDPFVWTNKTSIPALTLTKHQVITWSGGMPGSYVSISGYSFAHKNSPLANGSDVYTYFTCNAAVSGGQFTVPAAVLKSLLTSQTALGSGFPPVGNGYLSVVNEKPGEFTASGLNIGLLMFGIGDSVSVPFN